MSADPAGRDSLNLSPGLESRGLYRVAVPRLRTRYARTTDDYKSAYCLDRETVAQIRALAFQVLEDDGDLVQPPDRDYWRDVFNTEVISGAWDLEPDADDHVNVVFLGYADDEQSFRATVRITGEWQDNSEQSWADAAMQIKAALDAKFPHLDLDVEIIATGLNRDMYLAPILDQPDLLRDWNNHIQPGIVRLLDRPESPNIKMVNAITLCRLGFNHASLFDNPITVYIALDLISEEHTWMDLVRKLDTYLRRFPYNMAIQVEHNSWDLSTLPFQLVPPRKLKPRQRDDDNPYQQRVPVGADISFNDYVTAVNHSSVSVNPPTGTLGGYIELKSASTGEWRKFGLTTYHVIRPAFEGYTLDQDGKAANTDCASGTSLQCVDLQGIKPTAAHSLGVKFAHPALPRHNRIIASLKHYMSFAFPGEIERDKEKLESRTKFFDDGKHDLGSLFAASGFGRQTPRGQRLDWALIDLSPDRQGDNSLPSHTAWSEQGLLGHRPPYSASGGAYDRLKGPPSGSTSTKLDSFQAGTQVWKVGAATGMTSGLFTGFKPYCGFTESRDLKVGSAQEHMFEPHVVPEGFSSLTLGRPGDSGSIVFDVDGAAIGMVLRTMSPTNAGDGWTLVIPIEDVLNDIKVFTNAADIRFANP